MPSAAYKSNPVSQKDATVAPRPAWMRYTIAVASVGMMALARLFLGVWLEGQGRFILFLPAVLLASWYGGFDAALLALALGAAAGDTLFRFHSPPPNAPPFGALVSLILYLLAGVMIAWVNELQRREHRLVETSRQAVEQANHLLAQQHEEITALNAHLQQAMRETYHRVKNNLQVVAALVSMQIEEGSATVPMQELERLNQHIQALAGINDLLTQQARQEGEASSLSSEAILEKLLAMIPATVGQRRIHCDVETIPLSIRQGTSLALLINELISNAVKHGKGAIELTLRASEGMARLEVGDDGPGFPSGFNALMAAHTGLELIENISRKDLRGTVAYENRAAGGARVVVSFPIAAQAARASEALIANLG